MSCKQCGKCCTPIIRIEGYDKLEEYIKERYKDGYEYNDIFEDDYLFIYEVLTEISHDEAIQLNPVIQVWDLTDDYHIFKCPFLMSNNKCSVHSKLRKSAMCGGFPFYGNIKKLKIQYSIDCGYLPNEGR